VTRYTVHLSSNAVKALKKIPQKDQLRIAGVIELLAENPLPPKASKLSGREGYRVRSGNYRVIYTFERNQLEVLVIKIGHRRDIYATNGPK
jgi:mRNA interferase RelE/StbE